MSSDVIVLQADTDKDSVLVEHVLALRIAYRWFTVYIRKLIMVK